jgi:hypothetical protein
VEEDARRSEARQLPGLLQQQLRLAGPARAVDESRFELAARLRDRIRSLAQVRDVVERIVQAEDVDAVGRGRGDEAADEVVVDRTRAHQEAAAQREPERRPHARLQRADSLPRALDPASDGTLEAASARDFEVGEAGLVEDLGDAQLLGRRQAPRERLLPEQPDRRVREAGHAGSLAPVRS